ncbi:MAG: sulfotransferase family protein [Nanoarchaeota archaeon]|nr:sulfotransferase family protein [Nanoarchaeota archaeon]
MVICVKEFFDLKLINRSKFIKKYTHYLRIIMTNNQLQSKIFCIGLNKTGTTSLHEAFKVLGLKSVHWQTDEDGPIPPPQEKDTQIIISNNYLAGKNLLTGIENFDAYSDWSFYATNHLFTLLDKQCPGSKFILHTRDLKSWLKSRFDHVKRVKIRKERLEKDPNDPWYSINERACQEEYYQHHKNVLAYFKNRPHDLLIMNICKGDGWEKLCPFLKREVPNIPFPRVNRKPIFNSNLMGKVAPGLLKFSVIKKINNLRKKFKQR